MEQQKQRRAERPPIYSALSVFFVVLALGCILVAWTIRAQISLQQANMEQAILEKSLRVNEVVSEYLYKTQALAALVVQSDGEVRDFDKVAAALMDDEAILNVLLAPGGIVTSAYPEEQLGQLRGFDFSADMAGNIEAQLAVEKGEMVFSGPFVGIQGREILSGRLPIWLEQPGGGRQYWGLVSVTLKSPEALAGVELETLEQQGFAYEIWRTNPDDGQRQVIAHSAYNYNPDASYFEREISILNAKWYFRMLPVRQWYQQLGNWVLIFAVLAFSAMVAFIVYSNARLSMLRRLLEVQTDVAREAARRAEEDSRIKSYFLATVSHEFRTPLSGVIGLAQLAQENPDLPAEVRADLIKIQYSAEGLSHIVNDILDMSKVEAGRMELECIPFGIGGVVHSSLEITAASPDSGVLHLSANVDSRLDELVMGDPTKLRQVLLNLLSNAVKFTDEGFVSLDCRVLERGEGDVQVRFTVEDSGIGMSDEQLARIMQPYIQADSSTTRRFGGTGLGLAISDALVALMGGRLEAQSMEGIGSKFTFTLRFALADGRQAPLLATTEALPDMRPVFTGRVLLCEDTALNQEVIREQLERAGFEVTLAANGRQGIDAIRQSLEEQRSFRLIFMDIHMPEMDGLEAITQLREMGVDTPVVALTADPAQKSLKDAPDLGVTDYLPKPFTTKMLLDSIKWYLEPSDWVEWGPAAPGPEEEEPGRDLPAIDAAAGLALVDGDPVRYHKLLRRFLEENAAQGQRLERDFEKGDWPSLFRSLHSLKGMAELIGAQRLARVAGLGARQLKEPGGTLTRAELERTLGALDEALEEIPALLEE